MKRIILCAAFCAVLLMVSCTAEDQPDAQPVTAEGGIGGQGGTVPPPPPPPGPGG